MAKPSQCLAVMTRYFMPAALATATHCSALNLTGLKLLGVGLVLGHGDLGVVHDPFAQAGDFLAVILAGGHGVEAPMDEHAEARLAPPGHPRVALFFGLRGRGRDAAGSAASARPTSKSAKANHHRRSRELLKNIGFSPVLKSEESGPCRYAANALPAEETYHGGRHGELHRDAKDAEERWYLLRSAERAVA